MHLNSDDYPLRDAVRDRILTLSTALDALGYPNFSESDAWTRQAKRAESLYTWGLIYHRASCM